MYIRYLRHPGANVRWCYSHCKYIFSSSFAVAGISLFSIKVDKNGGSDIRTVRARVEYITVESFGPIGRGLNNVLPEGAQDSPHPYLVLK